MQSHSIEHISPNVKGTLRRVCLAAMHMFVFAAVGYSAFLLRFEFSIPSWQFEHLAYAILIWVLIKSTIFQLFGVDRVTWRYISLPDARTLLAANVLASVVSALAIRMLSPRGFPRSIYFIDLALCLLFTSGIRVIVRMLAEAFSSHGKSEQRRALIYGAGAAGVMLLRETRLNPAVGYKVCGFIDDNSVKAGLSALGAPVLGSGSDLKKIAAKFRIEHVLIAIPSATGAQMTAILNHCADAELTFGTVPGLSENMQKNGELAPIRDVAVEDLLGRSQVMLEDAHVRAKLGDKVILVTGAAGSIGSELCRQIARFGPKMIIGFDASETGLFFIERELQNSFPGVAFRPEIGTILDVRRLSEVFEAHNISTVFHAAAYKHVPLMEAHIFEAVKNNVQGTYNVATVAERFEAENFVMISSDKAVRPTSIMGLTKHVAELLVSSLQNGHTKFVSVRFGNVLGSNGSVVEIFKKQIAAGGPVTVTNREMRRYFMTIPEAAQLVLQASTMGHGGEVFVLDMGQPMKIVDLARNMILLSGRRPEDIRIEFTGTRPGEKLYEELSTLEEETLATYHEKIRIFAGDRVRIPDPAAWMEQLHSMCRARDMRLVLALKELVSDYNPSSQVLQRLMEQPKAMAAAAGAGRVRLSA